MQLPLYRCITTDILENNDKYSTVTNILLIQNIANLCACILI